MLMQSKIAKLARKIRPCDHPWLYLSILFCFVTLHNAWWLYCDRVDPAWDEANYLLNSLAAYDELNANGIKALWKLYFQSLELRPTFLFVVFSLPFYAMFGTTADVAILSTNSIFYSIIIISTFFLARHLFETRTALLATFVTALSPEVSALSRIYWPHLSVVAVASLGTYFLLKSEGLSRTFPSLYFGTTLGVGLMMRPVYPVLFLLPPLIWVIANGLFCGTTIDFISAVKRSDPSVFQRLRSNIYICLIGRALPALLLVLIIAGPFYLPKLSSIIKFASSVQSGNSTLVYSNPFWYIENLPMLITPFACLLLVIGFFFALKRINTPVSFLIFSLVATFIVISIPSFKRNYYFPPLVPLLAIVSTYWIFIIRVAWLRKVLVTVTVIMSLLAFVLQAWGIPSTFEKFISPIFPVQVSQPSKIDWHMKDLSDFILQNWTGISSPKLVVIGNFLCTLVTPSFRYLGESNKTDQFSYPFIQNSLEGLFYADYLVLTEKKSPMYKLQALHNPSETDFSHGRREVLLMLQNPNSAFYSQHLKLWEETLDNKFSIVLYSRSKELSSEEIINLSSEMAEWNPKVTEAQLQEILSRRDTIDPIFLAAYEESLRNTRAIRSHISKDEE